MANSMIKTAPQIVMCCCILFGCVQTRVARPTTLKCRCICESRELLTHVNDTLTRYGFINYQKPHPYALHTVKNFDDGISVRTVYLDAVADSTSASLTSNYCNIPFAAAVKRCCIVAVVGTNVS